MKNKKIKIGGNNLLLLITIVLFIIMYGIGCVVYDDKGFGHFQTFLNLLITNAGLICVACGMTCVMLTGGIDISVGSLVGLDCMIMAYGMTNLKWSPFVAIAVVLIVGIVFGAVQGFLIGVLGIQPFIISMAGMFFARGMIAVITTEMVNINNATFVKWADWKLELPFGGYTNKHGVLMNPFIRMPVIIALIVVAATFIILKFTKFGRSLYAVGGSESSAKLMGLNVKKTKMKAYMLSSFLCSIGGILYCLNSMCGFVAQAKFMEMDAIASSVIGGTLLTGGVGNVIGTLFGVLIKGTIDTLVHTNGKLLSSWSSIAISALLCFFIVLQAVFALVKEKRKE
ncbi:sugar ABC transporter permease YjfF [Butyribacter sp.]|uniref:ABC transporter permease subunit n=1 Tax=Butyribacter sp. TaxID=2822465 RepID=UPI002A9F511A|nr:sugar ABC transporter permease YjfF [Butyribacter sp.]